MNNSIEKLSSTTYAIQSEVAEIFSKMDATKELLAIWMSWGDTLPSEAVLQHLKEFNANIQPQHQSRPRSVAV